MKPAGESRQVGRLVELAAKRATGALHLNGRWGGVVFLERGEVAHVESPLTPGLAALLLRPTSTEERWAELAAAIRDGEGEVATATAARLARADSTPAAHLEILRRGATADAALPVLGAPGGAVKGRSRFRPGERHWSAPGGTTTVADLLAEVRRRVHVLSRLAPGVRPDLPVRRAAHLPFAQVRLTSSQWDVVRLADGVRAPLDIAWLLGHGVFATTVAVHELVHLGVLTVAGGGRDARPAAPAGPAGPPPPPGAPQAPQRHAPSFLRAVTATRGDEATE
jgi:hypothetical protein